jgi:hypothetical protein
VGTGSRPIACTWQDGRVPHPDRAPEPRAGHSPLTSRRTFLRGVLGAAGTGILGVGAVGGLAGCNPFADPEVEPQSHELEGFLIGIVALSDRYDTAIGSVAELGTILTPLRDAHRAHAQALAQALGVPVPPAGGLGDSIPADRDGAIAELAGAERSGRTEAVAACLAASSRLAPLLGSIAAARASHLEVLK